MKRTALHGVFDDRGLLWTKSRAPGQAVYGERLRTSKGSEFRSWDPYRSKLAALIRRDGRTEWIGGRDDVLYLGAASGTTVSHVSDLTDGLVYAVEFSPRSARDLMWNVEPRDNVVPILADARRPEEYAMFLDGPADVLVQDVAQRDQVEIFLRNMPLLRPKGLGILVVKARSIHVADAPEAVYARVRGALKSAGLDVRREVDLDPFEKDHRAFLVRA